MKSVADSGIDLADPSAHRGGVAKAYLKQLRDEQPVAWHPSRGNRPGFWTVTRYADVVGVCRAADTFSSSSGNVLGTLLTGGDSAANQMLAVSDGRRHLAMRRLLWQSLTPEALSATASRIRDNTRALVRAAVARGEFDFARDVAAQIPIAAICDLLGVPPSDREYILRNASASLSSEHAAHADTEAQQAKSELLLYFMRMTSRRSPEAAEPTLIDRLINGTVEGARLSLDEIVYNCYSLILGGDETTRLAMVSGLLALLRFPEQWEVLRAGLPVETAVDEILRWSCPVMHVGRTARTATEIGGQRIAAGDIVIGWLCSANFDEREFDRPERFDLTRAPNRHLTFSHGSHFCIGAHLTRIELSAVLVALREEVREIELAGDPVPIYSNLLDGYSSLPVRVR